MSKQGGETRRQLFARLVAEGKGYKEAAIEAGYSPSYSEAGRVQKTESSQEYFKKSFKQSFLAKKHRFLINTMQFRDFSCNPEDAPTLKAILKAMGGKIITEKLKKINESKPDEYEVINVFTAIPLIPALSDGLDKAYKLIGAYAPIKAEFTEPITPMSAKTIQSALASLSEQEKILINRFLVQDDGKTESAKQSRQDNKGASVHRPGKE